MMTMSDPITFFGIYPNGEGTLLLKLGTKNEQVETVLRDKDLKRVFRILKNFKKERKKVKKLSNGALELSGIAWQKKDK
jgi:hypothetical protein